MCESITTEPKLTMMHTAQHSLMLGALLVMACEPSPKPAPPRTPVDRTNMPMLAPTEPGVHDTASEEKRLGFRIDAMYRGQKLLSSPPWHEPTGTSTYFDAHMEDGTRFGFGWGEDGPLHEALLTTPDGAKLVAAFERLLSVKRPIVQSPHPAGFAWLPFALERSGEGRSSINLSLQQRGMFASLGVDFSFDTWRGTFTGFGCFAAETVALLARELRDGPAPPLTPESDTRVTRGGPSFRDWRTLVGSNAIFFGFAAHGTRALYSIERDGFEQLFSVALDDPSDRREIVRVVHSLEDVVCKKGTDGPCVVVEDVCLDARVRTLDEVCSAFYLIPRPGAKAVKLMGPWERGGGLWGDALSPDASILAVSAINDRGAQVTYFIALAGQRSVATIDVSDHHTAIEGWTGEGRALRAIVRMDEYMDGRGDLLSVNPRTGKSSRISALPPSLDPSLSPDGKRRVVCDGRGTVEIMDLASGTAKRFALTPDEQLALGSRCVKWATSRFLDLGDDLRAGFLDTDTLALNFPFEDEEEFLPAYNDSFTRAVRYTTQGLEVALLVSPSFTALDEGDVRERVPVERRARSDEKRFFRVGL